MGKAGPRRGHNFWAM